MLAIKIPEEADIAPVKVPFPLTVWSPVTAKVLPSNVKLASPLKEVAFVNVAILLFTPFVTPGIVVSVKALFPKSL